MQKKLEIVTHLSITTDAATSMSDDELVAVTGHFILNWKMENVVLAVSRVNESHTAQQIYGQMEGIVDGWGGKKIVACTTGAAAPFDVLVTARRQRCKLRCRCQHRQARAHHRGGHPLRVPHDQSVVCVWHSATDARCRRVTKALKVPQQGFRQEDWSETDTLRYCKRLVTLISKSNTAKRILKERQAIEAKEARAEAEQARDQAIMAAFDAGDIDVLAQIHAVPNIDAEEYSSLKLVKHVVTRWSSAYLMLKRLMALRYPVEYLINNLYKKMIGKINWQSVHGIIKLLEPFYEATQALQGDHYPTMSLVWRHLAKLQWTLARDNSRWVCRLCGLSGARSLGAEVVGVQQRLLECIQNDSAYLKVNDFVMLCTVLDPNEKVRDV